MPITPTLDGNPHHLHDFSKASFFKLFDAHGLRPDLVQAFPLHRHQPVVRVPARDHRARENLDARLPFEVCQQPRQGRGAGAAHPPPHPPPTPPPLPDFTKPSFLPLSRRHGLPPAQSFEQIQRWQFKGLFVKREIKQHRSEGVGNAVLQYYGKHPAYLLLRLGSMLRYGFSNRYLTCNFRAP